MDTELTRAEVYPEFYLKSVPDEQASAREGRPIYTETEMVKIIFPADRYRQFHAPATDTSLVSERDGYRNVKLHRSYIERFPKQYEAFKAGLTDVVVGTPLEALGLSNARVVQLRTAGVKTVEMLASQPESAIAKLGTSARAEVEIASNYLRSNRRDSDEVAALKAEIAALKAAKEAPTDEFADMDIAEIKAAIRAAGGTVPSGVASRETLVAALKALGDKS